MTADRADDLMLELMIGVALDSARRTGHFQIVMKSPACWTVRDAAKPAPEGFAWVVCVFPGDSPMGVMKRLVGWKQRGWQVPPRVPVADPRVVERERPGPESDPTASPPAFHVAPPADPRPAAKGAARQGSLFGD